MKTYEPITPFEMVGLRNNALPTFARDSISRVLL